MCGLIERLRYAPASFWRCVMVCGVILCALYAVAAQARDPDGRYANSPHAGWYHDQHNARGDWCCDESDGHPYFGDWKIADDGSVTVMLDGKSHKLPAYMVLKGPNPTGHAVWWYTDAGGEHRDYCFAPGSLT